MTGSPNHLFCFGYGYSCDYLGHALQQEGGWRISGTTRDPEKQALMRARGIKSYLFDYQKPLGDPAAFLHGATHVLISTPPNDEGDPAFTIHANDVLEVPGVQWVGYLSSTSVYGDRAGSIVDESVVPEPSSKRGSRRARAETLWMSLLESNGLPVHVFRLAGIYGPGRSALDSVRAGLARRVDKPGQAFSRIHVEDIVNVLLASMRRPRPGAVYNVADDSAAPSHEVIAYACELLGLPIPPLVPYEEADLTPMARSFYSDNKRVSNELIKQELGIALKYPDYKAGLRACLESENHHGALLPFIGVGTG